MALFLHRVGRLAFRKRWYVALIWAAVLAFAGLSALKAPAASDKGFSMPGIESQTAFDLMEQRFPGTAADGATARIVFVAPSGEQITDPGNKQAVEKTVAFLADGPQVVSASDPFRSKTLSRDGGTAYATVTYTVGAKELTDAAKSRLEEAVHSAQAAGLTVEVGGKALDA
ncbi:MMPL family transporter, partial [Streptomyces sp. SID5475]|nr:MMPL family transporter [Streptomyces sp. SID5475]